MTRRDLDRIAPILARLAAAWRKTPGRLGQLLINAHGGETRDLWFPEDAELIEEVEKFAQDGGPK